MYREYRPCLPTAAAKPPRGERYVHELKHDGYRLIARKIGKTVRLYTKNGYDWADRYPRITEALARARFSSIVLDGEAVCAGPDGKDNFDLVWNRCNEEHVRLAAFDLLELDGEDFRQKPLLERKRRLRQILSRPRDGIEYVEHLEGDGAEIFDQVCKLGSEGIVSKHIGMRYQAGPSKSWVKVKNRKHPAILRVKEAFERERGARSSR